MSARNGELGIQAGRKTAVKISVGGGGGTGEPPGGSTWPEPPPDEHAHIGVSANQGHGMHVCRKRQHIVLVLQQDDAFFSDLLGDSIPAFHVGNLPDHRVIEYARCENSAQNAMHVLVEFVLRDFAALHRLLQCLAKEDLVWLLHDQARRAKP